MVNIPTIYGDDWGMVYCYTRIRCKSLGNISYYHEPIDVNIELNYLIQSL